MFSYLPANDIVSLDGETLGQWPLHEAVALMNDKTPIDPYYSTQWKRFIEIARSVNGYARIPINAMPSAIKQFYYAENLEGYTTQYLLDVLFLIFRSCRWDQSGVGILEVKVREAIQMILIRVQSALPPIFITLR